jgi:short-subunit dehydrogenase
VKPADASVILTGASGGIGAATARVLVDAGARVLLVARDRTRLAALAQRLAVHAGDGHVAALAVDIATAHGRAQLREIAEARHVNVLVNNAGLPCFGAIETIDEARIAEVVATNLLAPIELTRTLLPLLRGQGNGIVLNIGSTLGRLGLPGFSVYAATKFGMRGFTESLRRELAGSGVDVLYLAPRATKTRFNDASVAAYNRATNTREDAPERVARAVLRTLERRTPERQLGFPEVLAVRLNALVPRWLDGAFARHRDHVAARPVAKESAPL